TKAPETTTKKTATGVYPVWSPDNVHYKIGDLVQYQDKVYECTYEHNSNSGWSPTVAVTLWKERTDLVAGIEETTNASGTEETTQNNYTVNSKLPEHMVTGYWHNFLNGSTALKLSDVPSYYDMICVAFANSSTTAGKVTFELDKDLSTALGGYTKAQFIQDIKDAKAKGQHVIISVGGAEGTTYITNEESANQFATSLISIIEEYGFEGVDIDFEGSAVSGTDYIAEALRTVHNHFGEDFIITMAPETYYFQDTNPNGTMATSAYYRLAYKIRDILTICYPQFYNSGAMNGYNGFNAQVGTADFLTSLSTLLLENGLRADQVALGLPSTPKAASSGYVSTDVISKAVTSLVNGTSSGSFTAPKAYPTFRGVMTWSINWDATNNYAWAKSMDSLMDSLEKHEQPTNQTTTTKTEVTTKNEENTADQTTKTETTTKAETTSSSQTEARPTEVIGLVKQSQDGGTVSFVWGQTNEQMESGQTYRVYADGKYVETFALATSTSYTFTTNGKHIIKVTANLNGYETEGKTIEVTIEGLETSETTKVAETTTKAPETTTKAPETTTKVAETTTKTPETTSSHKPTQGLNSRLLIGYYHTWDNSG
ncbi:glycosyl hydrolase family 18 protein, partial [Eubacterium sp. CAG:156]|uniref:glycosyl hydrolase family 18 protein n=1 Tax=Eubacterium sp. CAG:156 TaxID=1262880 RepID=UPI000A957D73